MMRNTAVAIPTPRGDEAAVDGLDVAGDRSPGDRMVEIARRELGVAETSENDSPRIAQFRTATEGAVEGGAWCAYFVSWVANKAAIPLGDQGQGFDLVDAVWAWAETAGRTIPGQGGGKPRPGDLIVGTSTSASWRRCCWTAAYRRSRATGATRWPVASTRRASRSWATCGCAERPARSLQPARKGGPRGSTSTAEAPSRGGRS
jgi:hypothetical protein